MTAAKSLPARPSLESLRKQAKKLARDVAQADAAAIARARAQLPQADLPLTQRSAQLVIAREYGFAGWQELTAEVGRRLGRGLEWAVTEARRLIHENDVERLRQLLADYPALLSWQEDDEDGGLLGMATSAYGDAGDEQREQWFTRGGPAEILIDAGAVVAPVVCDGILDARARKLLELFRRKGLLPATLEFHAALGDLDAVRSALTDSENGLAHVNEAFSRACGFGHEVVARLLLNRSIELDPELAARIGGVEYDAFVAHFIAGGRADAHGAGLWLAFVIDELSRAAHEGDVKAFVAGFRQETQLLGTDWLRLQNRLICTAVLKDHDAIIAALLDLDPAILGHRPPPASQAIEFAFTYARTHLVPLLTRIWPLPEDLPHAAGMGDLERVKAWFAPALRDVEKHYPYHDARARSHLHWEPPTEQQVLDVSLAFAVINRHFDVADFLLERGADIDTDWGSHEPASILHHVISLPDPYEAMQYLVDRGIDLTIKDYRWKATAQGWAYHALRDEKMAQWLAEAERQQRERR